MPTHIHLLLLLDRTDKNYGAEDPPPTIGTIIAWFKYQLTKQMNPRNCTRRIWQRSYYDHIIRNEQDYLAVWQYIDDNPAKWADDEYNALRP